MKAVEQTGGGHGGVAASQGGTNTAPQGNNKIVTKGVQHGRVRQSSTLVPPSNRPKAFSQIKGRKTWSQYSYSAS